MRLRSPLPLWRLALPLGAATCGAEVTVPTGPSITVDAPQCQASVETLFNNNSTPLEFINSIAVGTDGTVYIGTAGFAIYAFSAIDRIPRTVTSPLMPNAVQANHLWVDDKTLIIQSFAEFYTVP